MEFEWDEEKRLANIAKHGIDFNDLEPQFSGQPLYEVESERFGEVRTASTGIVDGRYVTAIWTRRDHVIRLISARRTRDADKRALGEVLRRRTAGEAGPW